MGDLTSPLTHTCRRMKVAMVGPFGLRPRGTMSVRALQMARALAARGHSVSVLVPPWQNPEDAGLCWVDHGVHIENTRLPRRIPGLFHLSVSLRLARRTLAARPDVVHVFKPKAYSGLVHLLLTLLPRARRPRIVVDGDDWEGAGGWNELGGYTWAQRKLFAWQEHWGLTHADAVIVASRTLQSLTWALGVSAMRVHYVPNGIGLRAMSQTTARPTPPGAGAVVLLYTRFVEFSVPRVLEVFARVRELVPDARLSVIGEGLANEEAWLMDVAQQRGLGGLVEHAPWDPSALQDHFARASLAIYPLDDTLVNRAKCPVKLLELLSAGVPVVAEAVGQAREFVRHGETGWLVRPGDAEEFARGVALLLREPGLGERLGSRAAQDVRDRFAWDRLVLAVERAYGIPEAAE